MSDRIEVTAQLDMTPELLAAAFWALSADEHADFFAELERLAGYRLCIQMSAVVNEIRKRADHGDRMAQQGFQTMLSHAQGYHESATDYRVWEVQRELSSMRASAKEQQP